MELRDDPGGEDKLLSAVNQALEAGDHALDAEARCALGLLYYFRGNTRDARLCLEQVVKMTPEGHMDRIAAETCLDGLISGLPMGEVRAPLALAADIRHFVLERIPEGVVSRLGVRVTDEGGVKWDVEVNRELTMAESRRLNEVIDEALRTFQLEVEGQE